MKGFNIEISLFKTHLTLISSCTFWHRFEYLAPLFPILSSLLRKSTPSKNSPLGLLKVLLLIRNNHNDSKLLMQAQPGYLRIENG